MYQQITLAAGVAQEFAELSNFLRIMKAVPTDIEIRFYQQGREVSRAVGLGAGYAERFLGGEFDRIRISSASGGAVDFVMRLGNEVRYDAPPTGNVAITNTGGAFVNSQVTTLTNAVQTIKAANTARRYLLVQNNDASLSMRLRLDGTDPTTDNGILLKAGESLELQGYAATGAVKAICTTAGTLSDVQVMEG